MTSSQLRASTLSVAGPTFLVDAPVAVDPTGRSFGPREDQTLLDPGTVINGRYRVEEVLGEGGMGVVYRVIDQVHPDRGVALKMIRGARISRARVSMFKAEFRAMAKLSHPNVAAVYDFEALQGTEDHLFTMEYVGGRDIWQATEATLLAGPVSDVDWKRVVDLLVEVCRALSYVHSRELIHFDVKPANVLVDPAGQVKVLDFGVAGMRQATAAHGMRGTPQYMAPELQDLDVQVDHRVDLYSLGIMTYQLLCRRLPFEATTLVELMRQHHSEPVVFDSGAQQSIPSWLRGVVERLCAKQAADRFRTANAVIEAMNTRGGLSYELETQETRESYVLSSLFVGREEQLQELVGFVERRLSDRDGHAPRAAFVGGQSGIGKSRLLRELRHRVQLSRTPFVEGNCYEGAFDEFGPIAEALSYVIRLAEASGGEHLIERYGPEIVKVCPALQRERGIEPSESIDNPEAEQLRLVDLTCEFLIAVAQKAPYVLYFNDLQWARPGAAELIQYLIRSISIRERAGERVPIGILGTFRDDEVESRAIQGLLDWVEARGEARLILLEPLDGSHVGRVLGSMLGIEALPPPFVERVLQETEGNPFFVEEVMRSLVANGSVYLDHGKWAATREIKDLDIPASITAVFSRRASLLNDEQRLVLDVVAVCAQPASTRVLEHATGVASQPIHQALGALATRRMVLPVLGDEPVFKVSHDRMRETLYLEIPETRRKSLHFSVAQALEEVHATDTQTHLYELAHHYWLSRDRDNGIKAVHYSVAAGDRAKETFANDLGLELYGRALALLKGRDEDAALCLTLTEHRGDLYSLVGKYGQATKSYEEVYAALTDKGERARLRRKIGNVFLQKGELTTALDHVWQALQLLGQSRPRTKVATLLAVLGCVLTHLLHRALPWVVRNGTRQPSALLELIAAYQKLAYAYFYVDSTLMLLCQLRQTNLADKLGCCRSSTHAYANTSLLYAVLSRHDGSAHYATRALDMATQLGSPWHIGIANSYYSMCLYHMGKYEEARGRGRIAADLLADRGDMFEIGAAYYHLAAAHLFRGEARHAVECAEEGLIILERTGSETLNGRALLAICGLINTALGRFEEAIEQLNRVMSTCEKAGILVLRVAQCNMGRALLLMGKPTEARSVLEQAMRSTTDLGMPSEYNSECYHLVCRAHLEEMRRLEDREAEGRRRQLHLLTKPLRNALKVGKRYPRLLSPGLITQGLVEWRAGNRNRAQALFEQGLEAAQQLGSKYYLADGYYEAGRCLWQEGGSPELGRTYLQKAVAVAEECEMAPYVVGARTLLEGRQPIPQLTAE